MSRDRFSELKNKTLETMNKAIDNIEKITDSEKTEMKQEIEKRLAPYPFDTYVNGEVNEDCILIMGINPAGDEKDVEREKRTGRNKGFYFCKVDTKYCESEVFKSKNGINCQKMN